MSSPRPITWWSLGQGCLPIFQKQYGTPAFIIGEDANNLLIVQVPSSIRVPIFELQFNQRSIELPILSQVQERLDALLDAAKFETCTKDTEPEGAFYGLVQHQLEVRATFHEGGGWVEVVKLGIAFSESKLTPQFGGDPIGFSYHEMSNFECKANGLPIFIDPSPPESEVFRPTRFEREDVV